jgi:Cytochrome domain of cellobiose dehydrogenase/Eukaryotic cytochrome b561
VNDDLFFHVSGPAGQAWLGFGFGAEMKGALMFVAYTSQSGTNVTISPRVGTGHDEPKFTSDVDVKVLEGSFVDNESYNINAQCTRCRSWPLAAGGQGTVDVASTAQPMIYAIGENSMSVKTDSQEATIREHAEYGSFTIDLKAATGDAGVPTKTTAEAGVTHGDASGSGHLGNVFHGLIMGACFVILFPLGALLIRLPVRLAFWLHVIWQSCTVFGVLVGFSLGIYISVKNNNHPKLDSAHQGLGIAITLLVLIQPTLGFLHHRIYKRTASPTLLGKIHRLYLGPGIILLGIVDGALGLNLAADNGKIPAYVGFVLFIAIVCALALWTLRRRNMRTKAANSFAASNFRDGVNGGGGGGGAGDVPLQDYGRLHGNASQHSFAQAGTAPPQYTNNRPEYHDQRVL